jgi:threonyl-tRNA synthetase
MLQLHSDFIEYEPIKKEIASAEDTEKKKVRLEEIVVLFTAVEEKDNESVVKEAVEDIKKILKDIKSNKVLIYPFAHLSSNLAKPNEALKLLKIMEVELGNEKIEVHRAPFGWCKQFSIKIKGHPLAERAKSFLPEGKGEGKPEKLQKQRAKLPKGEEKLCEKDHRVIGQQLDLYSFQECGPGMVFWHPKGLILKNLLMDFWRKEHLKRGYVEISTPIMLSKNLWEASGHWDHYKESMFFTDQEDMDLAIKPMNCPGAILIYKNVNRSYRDFPLRLAELGLVSRKELSGVICGLFRVITFVQDDAHIFLTPDQLKDEIGSVIDLADYIYKVFGFEYHLELSTKPENAMGSAEMWNKAEDALKDALKLKKMNYKINPGEGAFYGPKIDFHIKDSMGRTWQLGTIQVDFSMPERFDLNYVDKDGKNHLPVIIHRTIYGSLERFIGILVEHYQGKFPLWLSPIQAIILPISDENISYSEKIKKELEEKGLRVALDSETNTIEYKIRNAQLQKIPYMLAVGSKEEKNKTVAIRGRDGKVKYGVKLEDFIKQVKSEIENKK